MQGFDVSPGMLVVARAKVPEAEHGFNVLDCQEPVLEPRAVHEYEPPEPITTGQPPDLWELMPWVPAATQAAYAGSAAIIVWHFRLADHPG